MILKPIAGNLINVTTVHYIRHAQAENFRNVIYGRMPGFRLTQIGQNQARKAAQYLTKHKITHIYTSPLERAFETANIISEVFPKAPITHRFELIEVESTGWQGTELSELFRNDTYEIFINDPNANLGTENLSQLAQRMFNFNQEIVKKHKGEEVVCISHEFPIEALKLKLEEKTLKSLKTYHIQPCTIISMQFDENQKLTSSQQITPV